MFSDELEKISWEETTKAIYSKTEADVIRHLHLFHDEKAHLPGDQRAGDGDDRSDRRPAADRHGDCPPHGREPQMIPHRKTGD